MRHAPRIAPSRQTGNNKIDLAPYAGASLQTMERESKRMRGPRPFVFTNLRAGNGVDEIASFIEDKGGLAVTVSAAKRVS